ncbi:MAG TPA: HlyD family efflux transporter periplasmic adaptor subunit [Polyangiaceae bacterium]|nr:HlyD family efflux transporter periplasmic adaptor subunit [Polyangiaceae bacterium]
MSRTISTQAEFTGQPQENSERSRTARERRRSLLRNLRHGLLASAILAAAVASVFALRPSPVPVDMVQAEQGPLVVAIEETGVTRVKDRYLVSAPTAGRLSRLLLDPGDTVHEGDALAEIAPVLSPLLDERARAEAEARLSATQSALGQARAQVSRAQVAKELAEQELARTKRLASSGSLPQQALEQAEFAARMRSEELSSAEFASKVAAEEVRLAQIALAGDGQRSARARHVDVLAPASGQVLRVHQKSAGVVQAGTPLVEVGDPRVLEVVVDLLTTDAVQVQLGTPVVLKGWGGQEPLAGKVRRVEPSAFTRPSALGVDEQRVNVLVALSDSAERSGALGDGYRVEARLVLWRADSVLKVPQGAVFRRGDAWALFRIEDSVARLTPVKIGHRGDTEVEILSGLAAGARVAVHPGDRVKDGARVEAR